MTLVLDSDPSLIPRSSVLPRMSANSDGDDDSSFWSERQTHRIAHTTRTDLDIGFVPEAIGATRTSPRLRDAFLLPSNCWDLRVDPGSQVLVHSFWGEWTWPIVHSWDES